MPHKITLVDDDQNITTSLSMALRAEDYEITVYHDGQAGLEGIQKDKPDLAVLDVKMPVMDGMELLTKLREEKISIPVIFLTSKDDEIDQVLGLRMGADDYITKPFSQRLLIERIKSLLRRVESMKDLSEGKPENEDSKITRGDLVLDESRFLCSWKSQPLNLTVTEYLLIKSLAMNPGHVKSREQLIESAYGENIYVDDRTVDSHIKRLRKKFKDSDDSFDKIETLYGVGYRYKED